MNDSFKSLFKDISFDFQNLPVAFVFKNNSSAFLQWSIKYENFRSSRLQLIEQLRKAENTIDIKASSLKRLSAQKNAAQTQLQQIENLLKDFSFSKSNQNTQSVLQHRIPSQQHFESYFKNIFRDWASWGEAENSVYLNLLKKIKTESGKVLIVGGGAGRLAYDLCQLKPQVQVMQLDINPLLTLIAQKICSGETVELTETAQFPTDSEHLSLTHKLKAPTSVQNEQLHLAVGDICEQTLQDQQFDAVICPWVIDILPENFSDFSKRLNFLLKPQGELLIFGPLSFEKQSVLNKLTFQEVIETLNESGFELSSHESLRTPYLQSPLEAQQRFENITVFHAIRNKATKRPKAVQHYPDWLIDTNLRISASQSLVLLQSQKNLEAQFLGGLLSGKSIKEMAAMIAQSGSGMSPTQAEDFVQSVFARLVETGDIKND